MLTVSSVQFISSDLKTLHTFTDTPHKLKRAMKSSKRAKEIVESVREARKRLVVSKLSLRLFLCPDTNELYATAPINN